MNISHFLITRFNLRKKEWCFDKNQKKVLDEVWLEKRIQLFSKFCLPSVLSQTTKNFEWLIFFEKDSRENIKPFLAQLKSHSFVTPILVEGYDQFQETLPGIVSERVKGEIILTTRLDNDDALHKDFMEGVQMATNTLKAFPTMLFYPNGLFLDVGLPARLGEFSYPKNQFLTLAERNSQFFPKTVYGEEHHKWRNLPYIVVNNKYSWLQISHEDNQENDFKGWLVSKGKLKEFNVSSVKFPCFYFLKVILLQIHKQYVEMPGRYFLKSNFIKFKRSLGL